MWLSRRVAVLFLLCFDAIRFALEGGTPRTGEDGDEMELGTTSYTVY